VKEEKRVPAAANRQVLDATDISSTDSMIFHTKESAQVPSTVTLNNYNT
jgi:hypothetical protein